MWTNENAFDSIITTHAGRLGVPVPVVKATIAKESSFNPAAKRDDNGDGVMDSRGLGQLLESTARWLGYKGLAGDDATGSGGLYEPEISIHLTVKYLQYLRSRYPTEPWEAIYAAYNSGAVRRSPEGKFINSKGLTTVEDHVVGWRKAYAYFTGAASPKAPCPLCRSGLTKVLEPGHPGV